jgi:Spy/CpxP family protein refolding chaperone
MKAVQTMKWMVATTAILMAGVTAGAQHPTEGGDMRTGMGERQPPMERAMGLQGQGGRWWNNAKLIERLKLTDDQRKAMDNIMLEHRAKLVDLHATLEKAELLMEPMLRDDQPNETKILAQIDQVAQARAELEKANARFLLALRSKLTAEQWKQVQAFRAEERQQFGGKDHSGQGMEKSGHSSGMEHPQMSAPQAAPQGNEGGSTPEAQQ